jgi:hypothetical protein
VNKNDHRRISSCRHFEGAVGRARRDRELDQGLAQEGTTSSRWWASIVLRGRRTAGGTQIAHGDTIKIQAAKVPKFRPKARLDELK